MNKMIRPLSDLRDHFVDISETAHRTEQPIFLTKDGYGDMVILSIEAYESLHLENEIYVKLKEAEKNANETNQRFSSKEVLDDLNKLLRD